MTAKSVVNNVSSATGASRASVVIGLLIFVFVLFAAARGSLSQYFALLFTSTGTGSISPSAPSGTSVNGVSQTNAQSNESTANILNDLNNNTIDNFEQ